MTAIRISALVSLYNSQRFVRGAMEDLVGQTSFQRGELEIVVVNSGSLQHEEQVVREFQSRYPRIKYLHTERETIYGAWNRAIALAEGTYLTNANSDDRHRPDALERLAEALDRTAAGVAYADSLITRGENETFERNTADRVFRWPDYSLRELLVHFLFGPQPMWRRDIHAEVGMFEATYALAGDYDFLLRAAWRKGAVHLRDVLGLYYEGGAESRNLARMREETERILHHYRSIIPVEDVYPGCRTSTEPAAARAVALWDYAHCLCSGPHNDLGLARRLRARAGRALLAARPRAWFDVATYLLRGHHPVVDTLPPMTGTVIESLTR